MKNIYSTLFVLIMASASFGQVTITQNSNSQALSQLLAGTGVTISNYSMSCAANGSGTFNNVNSNLGIQGGVVLASGRVQNISSGANTFASTQFTATGDAQLATLTTGTIYDPCVLQFDIIPQGSVLKFDYVFASEEYPEWVCSKFNDVFGFFITGPNPAGGNYTNKNIALITGTNLPVAINTVNPGTPGASANGGTCTAVNQTLNYSSLYISNQLPVNPSIVYDGMTHLLTATANVTPCQTYHLKIAIADVADRIYDSGVFLSAYSFTSNSPTVTITSNYDVAGFSSTYEGCAGGTFTFTLSQPQATATKVPVVISGTATNGSDYPTIADTVTIPAGQTSVSIHVNPTVDGIAENTETVTISNLNMCTGAVLSTATLNISDDMPVSISVGDSTLCPGQSTQLTASGGLAYSWTPTTGLSNPNIYNPVASPTATTTYMCNITLGSCNKAVSQTIYVSNLIVTATPTGVSCNGGSNASITTSVTGGIAPYTYNWGGGITTANRTNLSAGTYTVTVTDNNACSITASAAISQPAVVGINMNSGTSVCLTANGTVNAVTTGGTAPYNYVWSNNGPNQQQQNGLPPGPVSVTVTDANGCSATGTITVGLAGNNTDASFTYTGNPCAPNAAFNFTHTGSNNQITHFWDFETGTTSTDANPSYTFSSPGTYNVTHIVYRGYCNDTSNQNVIVYPTPAPSSENSNVTCNGLNNGSVDLTVASGTPGFTYLWNNGATTEDRTGLTAGTYSVTVTDASACTVSFTTTITQPSALVLTNTKTNVTCNGADNGTINLTVNGGTPAYTLNWNDGSTIQNRNGLTAGNYSVTVVDNNLCSAVNNITLTQPGALNLTTTVSNVTCNGLSNGTISLSVAGGNGAYNYNWGSGVTNQNRTNLPPGVYNVTVTDANGCSGSTSAVITQPQPLVTTLNTTNIACTNGNNGSIQTTVNGGTAPYTYHWNDGNISINRNSLSAGTYILTVNDYNNCSATASATITQPAVALNIVVNNVSNVNCYGNNSGAINITTGGGTQPYSYVWNDGNTSQNRTNLAAGNFQLTVTDSHGCSATVLAQITQPLQALNIGALTATDVLCYGASNGSITSSVTGGTYPYYYSWSNGSTTSSLSNLAQGSYFLTVSDYNGCSASAAANVSQPASGLSAGSIISAVNCFGANNGAINLTVAGGTIPYTFNWGGGVTTEDRTGLPAGTYTVIVTDANNCTVSKTNSVTQPDLLSVAVTSTQHISCYGESNGSITVSANGGTPFYSYLWSDGSNSQNRTNISSGNYQLSVTDSRGCITTTSATITQPQQALSISAVNPVNVLCFGNNTGSISINLSGGTTPYFYQWNNGNTTPNLTNLTAGNYAVTVTDNNSCSATANAVITQPTSALNAAASATNIGCYGGNNGNINLTATGGVSPYTFNWGGGITTEDRTGLTQGTYAVTITDANNCTVSKSVTLGQPSQLLASFSSTHQVSCHGGNNGSITLAVSGGTPAYLYNWNDGATTQNRTNLSAGNYRVTVTDVNACSAVTGTTISHPASPLGTSANGSNISCYAGNDGSVTVIAQGGTPSYSYNWNNGLGHSQAIIGLRAGNYTVTVSDANLCTAVATAILTQPGPMQLAITKADPVCNGTNTGSINLTATGGVPPMHYMWSTGAHDEDLDSLSTGAYSVIVTDNNGCSLSASSTLTVVNGIAVTENHTNVSCNSLTDAIIHTQTTGGAQPYQYLWNTNSTTPDLLHIGAGTYSVVVTDKNGCTAGISAVTITEPASLAVGMSVTDIACAGISTGSINASVSGGTTPYQYHWNNGWNLENLANADSGTYFLTVTDANGCSITANGFINSVPPMIVNAITNPLVCMKAEGQIDLTVNSGTAPYTYLWSNGATTQDLNGIHPGVYHVTVHDANNCMFDTSFTVVNLNTFSVHASGGGTITLGETSDLHVTSTGSEQTAFNWTPVFGMNCSTCNNVTVQPGQSTLYTVVAIDTNGCEAQDTVSIEVIQDHTLFPPNAFSPNNDGNNDVFQLFGNIAGIKTFNVMIFDRWGEKVFESDEATFSWDGTYKGQLLGPTVCVYVMKIVFLDGYNEKVRKGSLTILR